MDIRQATTDDVPAIREVAHASLTASYDFLDEYVIGRAIEQWYGDDSLEEAITEDSDVILVGSADGDLVGFTQSAIVGEGDSVGEIRWIHVDPDHRGKGIGPELYDRTEDVLRTQGVDRIRGLVLSGNETGQAFYENEGLDRVGEHVVEIGDEEYTEVIFESKPREAIPSDEAVDRREVDGKTVYVAMDQGERGSKARFHPAYSDDNLRNLYAWYCAGCGSFDNAMDSMGRIECNQCGNVRKPTRWDASYL